MAPVSPIHGIAATAADRAKLRASDEGIRMTQDPSTQPSGMAPGPEQGPPFQNWSYAGQQAVKPQRSLGVLLILVAVGSLLFTLACGCVNGWWVTTYAVMRSGSLQDQSLEVQFRVQFESMKNQALEQADSEAERERIINSFDVMMREGVPDAFVRSLRAAAGSPAGERLLVLGTLSMAAHAALFLGAILLFLRRPSGKWISLIACVMLVGLNALTAVAMQDVISSASDELQPTLEQIAHDSGHPLDIAQFPHRIAQIVVITTFVSAALMSLWPVTAGLILALSRGIARDLSPQS